VSTHDLPLAETLAVVEKELFYSSARIVGLDTCVEERRERKRVFMKRREEVAYRVYEFKSLEIKRKILKLKMKMKELTKTGGIARGAHSKGVKWSDQEAHRASSSDQEDGGRDQGDSRTGSGLRKVNGLTGRSLTSRGQGKTSRRKDLVVKSEPGVKGHSLS